MRHEANRLDAERRAASAERRAASAERRAAQAEASRRDREEQRLRLEEEERLRREAHAAEAAARPHWNRDASDWPRFELFDGVWWVQEPLNKNEKF